MKGCDYFNSGMLLIDIDKYVQSDIGHTAVTLAAERSFPQMDQDVLNIVLEGKVYFTSSIQFNCKIYFSDRAYEREKESIKIIHFTGKNKPWKMYTTFWKDGYREKGQRNSWKYAYYEAWRQYAAESPWKDVPYVMPQTYTDWRFLAKAYYNSKEYKKAAGAYLQYLRKKLWNA